MTTKEVLELLNQYLPQLAIAKNAANRLAPVGNNLRITSCVEKGDTFEFGFFSNITDPVNKAKNLYGPWLKSKIWECFSNCAFVDVKYGQFQASATEAGAVKVVIKKTDDIEASQHFKDSLSRLRQLVSYFEDKSNLTKIQATVKKYNMENQDELKEYCKRFQVLSVQKGFSSNAGTSENDARDELVEPCFWKFSFESPEQREVWEERHVLSMQSTTMKRKQNLEPIDFQRELFQYAVRVGDFAYVCDGIKILSLVKITNVRNGKNRGEDLNECDCEIIVDAYKESTYNDALKRNWTPNTDVKFVRVPVGVGDKEEFDNKILKPYFGKTVDELTAMSNVERKYWWLVSDPKRWKLSNMEVGMKGKEYYFVYKQDGARGRKQNPGAFMSCREGDTIIGYVSKGDKTDTSPQSASAILQFFDVPYFNAREWTVDKNEKVWFIKKQDLTAPVGVSELQNDTVLKKVADRAVQRVSLFEITKDEYRAFMKLAKERNPEMEADVVRDEDLVTLSVEEEAIKDLLEANLNVILTGAPGTGKTYAAKRIAFAMTGDTKATSEEESHIASVQFHPGYDYSDFVIGMKPVLVSKDGKEVFKGKDGKLYTTANNDPNGTQEELTEKTTSVSYDWKDGVFKKFAAKAKKAYDAVNGKKPPKFVFVIDEINRADLSRVFGELFSLLEEDYRYPRNKNGIRLPNGESFVIPENLYIIGTMNDIDRSVESMEFALRRRFAWYGVKAESSKHRKKKKVADENAAQKLESAMDDLNELIAPPLNKKDGSGTKNQGTKPSLDLRLGSEYQLGGAIFAKFEKYQNDSDDQNDSDAYTKLWDNHIENILSEYLRGRSNRKELVEGLKQAFDDAIKGKPKQTETQAQGSTSSVANGDSSAPSENT